MNLFGIMDISASGLQSERVRAEVIASNMANAETTRTPEGFPYQRHHVVIQANQDTSFRNMLSKQVDFALIDTDFGSPQHIRRQTLSQLNGGSFASSGGVSVAEVIQDSNEPLKRYEPGHPDADANGFVLYPDINPLTEMVDLMGATRSYGMNASAIQAEKIMLSSSFEILK